LRLLKELSINIEELSPSVNYLLRADNYFSTSFNICEISAARIDEINILNASLEAMNNSFTSLFDKNSSGLWLVDGNKSPRKDFFGGVEIYPLVKGDSRDVLIGLASVIAKEYRDRLMEKLSNIYSGYGFEIHAGYPTPLHKDLIQAKGICEIHRKSFKGVKEWVVQN
jgi:ribonuclease HII